MKNKLFRIISGIIMFLVIICIGIIVVDYTLVINNKEPFFCLKREVKENADGNTTICTGFAYKYYDTVGNGYVSKKFIPIWQKEVEDVHE